MKVSAVVVTRGNVDLSEILLSLEPFQQVIVWENGAGARELVDGRLMPPHDGGQEDLGVYGRYAALDYAAYGAVFTQDDDCVLPPGSLQAIVAAYEPGVLTANMPAGFRSHYYDSCLVGFGAIFDRELPEQAFEQYGAGHEQRPDVVFSALTPRKLIDVPYRNLPWATGADRAYRQPGHTRERQAVLRRARRIRDGLPA